MSDLMMAAAADPVIQSERVSVRGDVNPIHAVDLQNYLLVSSRVKRERQHRVNNELFE